MNPDMSFEGAPLCESFSTLGTVGQFTVTDKALLPAMDLLMSFEARPCGKPLAAILAWTVRLDLFHRVLVRVIFAYRGP